MNQPEYISHLYHDGTEWHFQSNEEHCRGAAELARNFASEFGMGEWGFLLGLMHDRGKECEGFQSYIRRNSGLEPDLRSSSPHLHSISGAVITHTLGSKDSLFWLSNPIAGHHRGLYDTVELEPKLKSPIPEDLSKALPSVDLPLPKIKMSLEDSSFIPRMLFSCLVDADRLDTERFMSPEKFAKRRNFPSITRLISSLNDYTSKFEALPRTDLNKIRSEIQQICIREADREPGFFELTVPTGGGKTIASVIWALHHALKHGKQRVVIAIPFTSIIVQTAAILKDIFGDDNVIEHHSALNEETTDERSLLATENWDAPIIVTTNVQLFESIFSNKPSKCRKLHSLSNCVVVLDEVQTLPVTFLQPILNAMKAYAKLFGTSFLFSTATQPVLTGRHKGNSGALFSGLEPQNIYPIVPSSLNLHQRLRRVRFNLMPSRVDYSEIASLIAGHKRALCVVNTRKDAFEIFSKMPENVNTFHLSRFMCSAHLLATINEIKKILETTSDDVRVISTQLIEAGVDIDFPIVYRQLSGLDSILQAAGRCNREAKQNMGNVNIFSLIKDSGKGALKFAADTMKDLISLFPDADWSDPSFISLYYSKLYARANTFDKEGIVEMLNHPKFCRFEEASEKFRLIDEAGRNIIVNFGESEKLINQLKRFGPTRKLARELGRYSVSVPERIYKSLAAGGLIEEPWKGFFFIPLKTQYDEKTGLKTENDYLDQNFIL
ncbi:MAG: CRISPR-associated helicase Cas3' [Muribaculaceae bacterium]|nr:CRISPR-associated helicase Cas3' [Muribaculaceae bacterium]